MHGRPRRAALAAACGVLVDCAGPYMRMRALWGSGVAMPLCPMGGDGAALSLDEVHA